MRSSRALRVLFSLAVAVSALQLVPLAGTAGAAPCMNGEGVIVLRSLHIEAQPSKKVVAPGDKFSVKVTVTRPAHEDPADLGIQFEPPASVPAEDVTVGLSVWVGERTYFWNIGTTDANGEVTLPLKVPARSEVGPAFASISGRHWIKNDCPDILEDGYRDYARFVVIKR